MCAQPFASQAQIGRVTIPYEGDPPYVGGPLPSFEGMPGPWIQSALDPGWLAGQSYPEGSTVEFVAYWRGARTLSRVLATVLSTQELGTPRHETKGKWLAVQVRCVEDHKLFQWLGTGGGAKQKGRFDLHLCLGQVDRCTLVRDEEEVEVHTDTLRMIGPRDLEERISEWWTTSPTKTDFEALRARVLRNSSTGAKAQEVPPQNVGGTEASQPGCPGVSTKASRRNEGRDAVGVHFSSPAHDEDRSRAKGSGRCRSPEESRRSRRSFNRGSPDGSLGGNVGRWLVDAPSRRGLKSPDSSGAGGSGDGRLSRRRRSSHREPNPERAKALSSDHGDQRAGRSRSHGMEAARGRKGRGPSRKGERGPGREDIYRHEREPMRPGREPDHVHIPGQALRTGPDGLDRGLIRLKSAVARSGCGASAPTQWLKDLKGLLISQKLRI